MNSPHARLHLLIDGSYGQKVEYALESLNALKGLEVERVADPNSCNLAIATLSGSELIAGWLEEKSLSALRGPESFVISHVHERLVAVGSDEQGLMYALLEIAEHLEEDLFSIERIEPMTQRPENEVRGLFTFLHNRDCEDEWFHSEEHWSAYFDLLARSRFNSFNLVLGHQTNYLVPPFPFLLDVPEHPEVHIPDLTAKEQCRNLRSLKMITDLAESRGLEFVLGIWEVIAWTSDSRGGHTQKSLVSGLDWANLTDYTYHAMGRLLDEIPGIRGVQLRVNGESGVPPERQTEFFSQTIFRALRETDGDVFLDLRGWMAEETTIAAARSLGIPIRLSMKYWAEHLGGPYQAAAQEPAYSYADFLRRPLPQPAIFQVWALGSHRQFLWGDPAYVRTFASTLQLGGASGFEISPPLAQKGFGNEPGHWRVLQPEHEYYRWEWERYWMFYVLFGRLTYDRHSSPEPWRRRLRARFGPVAALIEETYSAMSKVISFLMAFHMSDPNMYIWPEADTGGVLDFYMSVPPSDPIRFEGIQEAARRMLSDRPSARVTPDLSARKLNEMGHACLDAAASLAEASGHEEGAELRATAVDATALGHLALYHSEKTRAALALALYYETGDMSLLLRAGNGLRAARPHWEALADVTDGFYAEGQVTGPVDAGHWKDRLQLVEEDEARIEERIELHRRHGCGVIGGAAAAFDMGGAPVAAYSYTRFPVQQDMVERGFTGVDESTTWGHPLTSSHGWESVDGSIRSVQSPLARLSDRHLDYVYRDTMSDPGHSQLVPFIGTLLRDYVAGEGSARFNVSVPAGTYETTVVLNDQSQSPAEHGPFSIYINGDQVAEALVVAPEESREIRVTKEVARGLLSIDFQSQPGSEWFCSAVIVRPLRPHVAHVAPLSAAPSTIVTLSVSVTSVVTIHEVTLEVEDGDGPRAIPMTPSGDGVYEIELPSNVVVDGAEIAYRFRVEDEYGSITWLPAPHTDRSDPCFPLRVRQDSVKPRLSHEPIQEVSSGQEVVVEAKAATSGVTKAILNYRYVNQYYPWNRVAMTMNGELLRAVIPVAYVVPEWDLIYFIEVFDEFDNGSIVPGGHDLLEVPYWVTRVSRS